MKKENKLSKEQTSHNETLAEEFNPDGQFPKVIILDSDRKTLGQINYEPGKTAEDYIAKIQKIINE